MRQKLLLLLLGVLSSLPTLARDFEYEYEGQTIIYTVLNEEAKTCKTKDGENSVSIGAWAGNKVSSDLYLPVNPKDGDVEYTLTSIGKYAFLSCRDLNSVVIPNSVQTIGNGAFEGCSGLTSVVIGESVTSIGEYAFDSCSSLPSVVIGESVTSIGKGAFYDCSGLTSVVIPNSVTSIGEHAFKGCSSLSSVTFNAENCKECGNYDSHVFPNALEHIVIGETVKKIPAYAFYGCYRLTSVEIPNSLR